MDGKGKCILDYLKKLANNVAKDALLLYGCE